MSNKLYDVLKFLAQIGLPALATLYFSLAGLWGLPNAEEVVGTIVAVDTFLGVLLGMTKTVYDKNLVATGDLKIMESSEGKSYALVLDESPDDLEHKDKVVFKVR